MKLLAFDVDDTLLGDDKVFRQSTIDHLNRYLAQGDVVAIVSGRPYIGVRSFLSKLGPGQKYPVAANGAAVYTYEGEPLFVEGLPYRDFLSFRAEHQDIVSLGGQIYCYTLQEVGYFEDGFFTQMEVRLNGIGLRNLNERPLEMNEPILKIMLTLPKEKFAGVKLTPYDEKTFHIIRSDPRFLEFTNPHIDKATGVEFLRKRLLIDKKDVYCFGDQGNDVGMIAAYNGVAMGNAIPEAKAVAKFVTLSANEDGVSYALDHFVK